MRVRIDQARCQGHTQCSWVAPELFDLDPADGHGRAKVEIVPPEMLALARRAQLGCPERAIEIDE